MSKTEKIAIIGAGPAGSLLAIYLAQRGMAVDVYEARGDMRKQKMSAGRSINMALSNRGIAALRQVGMDEFMLKAAIPMHGRMIHAASGDTKLLPYSGRSGEYINSISRGGLNAALMDAAERHPNVAIHFGDAVADIDADGGVIEFASGKTAEFETAIAADGAGSVVRRSLERSLPGFASSSEFLDHAYKELHIPPGPTGKQFQLEKEALHIWPRHQFMIIALPNLDGSFTCTLFISQKSSDAAADEPSFERLADETTVDRFFRDEFPDAYQLMPTLTEDFFNNPVGSLGTVKCGPWNIDGRVLILGDAAHAVVPFYGQGMNCAFEDVRILDELIDRHGSDWPTIFDSFYKVRKPNADAIADMAVDNFYEMRDRVADPIFQRKRSLETRLEQTFPDYFSKYSMVTFREDLPYTEAKRRGEAQDELLMEICRNEAEPQPEAVIEQVRRLTAETN